jgi:hypothetical protein
VEARSHTLQKLLGGVCPEQVLPQLREVSWGNLGAFARKSCFGLWPTVIVPKTKNEQNSVLCVRIVEATWGPEGRWCERDRLAPVHRPLQAWLPNVHDTKGANSHRRASSMMTPRRRRQKKLSVCQNVCDHHVSTYRSKFLLVHPTCC